MSDPTDRRTVLRATGAAVVGALVAGCTSGDSNDGSNDPSGNTVLAGPDGNFQFDPEEITVSTGDTVTWEFESAGHNVSAIPDHHDAVKLPDGAEPFGSMGPDGGSMETESKGSTYEHTFEAAGTYRYVCVPHTASEMIGTVVVEE